MIKKLSLFLGLFVLTFNLSLAQNLKNLSQDHNSKSIALVSPEVKGVVTDTILQPNDPYIFAALPDLNQEVKTSVKTSDARAELLRQYMKHYDSPLTPYADLIVELSDRYNFDYRWMVAIAMQESSLCRIIPENSYNCWGWGIYPEPSNPSVLKVTRFDSFEDALRRIAPQFTKIFLKGKHTKDPMEVMKTYTPPSDGSWAKGVNHFFGKME